MNNEILIYRKNRINELNRIFNSTLARLNTTLATNIRSVQKSRNKNKQQLINALIAKYNSDVAILRKNLAIAITNMNSFKPNAINNKPNNKKALLIGVNYINTAYELSGCIDDTYRMKELLSKRGFTTFQILTDVTDTKPTKTNILNELKQMIVNAQSGDLLFFYFSGHGSYTYDTNGDETDRKDEMIISCDLQGVIDDDLKSILTNYLKRDISIICLFDSCHSGTILDLKYNYLDSNNYDKYSENDKVNECNGNVIMISGCMDAQTSAEAFIDNKAQGAMTWSFIQSINKTPNCSWREILISMRDLLKTNKYTQKPQMSTNSFYDIDAKIII